MLFWDKGYYLPMLARSDNTRAYQTIFSYLTDALGAGVTMAANSDHLIPKEDD
jgi:hypothetical protein